MMPDREIIESSRFPAAWKIIPFHVKHIHYMSLSELDLRTVKAYDNFDEMVTAYAERFYAFTVCIDDKPVASYLLFNLWPGNWEVTVFKDFGFAKANSLTFTMGSRRMIGHIVNLPYVRRLQITVRDDNPYALRWAELIGFKHEAFLESYAPDGCDAHILKRLNHGIHSTGSRI